MKKKKVFRILELARPAPKKMDPEDIAHRNRIKQMERECDRMHEERGLRDDETDSTS